MTASPLDADEHAERLIRAEALASSAHLGDDPAPTRNQVAAVLHALADHTLLMHLMSDDVADLDALDRDRGPQWHHASGAGRYLQGLADHLSRRPGNSSALNQPRAGTHWPLGTPG